MNLLVFYKSPIIDLPKEVFLGKKMIIHPIAFSSRGLRVVAVTTLLKLFGNSESKRSHKVVFPTPAGPDMTKTIPSTVMKFNN